MLRDESGRWRCLTQNWRHAAGDHVPEFDPRNTPDRYTWVTCGHSWEDASDNDAQSRQTNVTCRCGTFAIGYCLECGRPTCPHHSAVRDDRRLCSEHQPAPPSPPPNPRLTLKRQRDEWLLARGEATFMRKLYQGLARTLSARGEPQTGRVWKATPGATTRDWRGRRRPPALDVREITTGWIAFPPREQKRQEGDPDARSVRIWTDRIHTVLGSDGNWWEVAESLGGYNGPQTGAAVAAKVNATRDPRILEHLHLDTETFMHRVGIAPTDLGLDWPPLPWDLQRYIPEPFALQADPFKPG